jgi:hypothetical protein
VNVLQKGTLMLNSGSTSSPGRIRMVAVTAVPPPPPGNDRLARTGLPHSFALEQNYPNPFNPSTTIVYALSEPAFVTMRVYNLLGEIVSTLVNERQGAGYRSVLWDASQFGSGVYYVEMTADKFSATRKMLLMK